MAEGLIGGVIGDEEDSSEADSDALAGADAFAAAIAARLSANDPGVSRKTQEFLAKQTRLVAVQRAHLVEEHALRLSKLRGQRQGIHIPVAFQVFVALVASVIGIGFAVLVRDAVTSRGVIVEAFEAAPALAPRGVSVTVVAAALLDELARLKDSSSARS